MDENYFNTREPRTFVSVWDEAAAVCRRVRDRLHKKRWGRPKQEDGKLDVWFGKLKWDDPDLCVQSGNNTGGSSTRSFVLSFFMGSHPHSGASGYQHSFLKEMESRGFDISTLKFSIRKRVDAQS